MKKLTIVIIAFLFITEIKSQFHENWINYSPLYFVTDIVVEDDFVWTSAFNGITKYNKNTGELTYLDRANSILADNRVLSLHLDSMNNLWYGCQEYGVGKLTSEGTEHFTSSNSGLPMDQDNFKISEDKEGNIWIISSNSVSRIKDNTWKTWSIGDVRGASDIAFDSANIAYIISTSGLGKIENEIYTPVPGILTSYKPSIAIDGNNTIWVADYFLGLFEYNNDTIIRYSHQNSDLPYGWIGDVACHNESGLWIATKKGLVNFTNKEFILYEAPNQINRLAIDSNGSIWCAYGGLIHFKDSVFKHIDLTNNSLTLGARMLLIDNDNTKWIADDYTLNVKTDSTFENYIIQEPIAATQDHEGAVWVVYKTGDIHLQKFTEQETVVFDSTNSPLNATYNPAAAWDYRSITDMVADQNNHIWIATSFRGLYEYDGSQFINHTAENSGLPSNRVGKLLVDNRNNLWGASNGLFKFDGETWINWNTENSNIPNDEVFALSFDPDSILWISNKEAGISSFNGIDFITYDTSDSGFLPNVLGMLAEGDSVWLATVGAGLMAFDKNNQWKSYNVSNSGIVNNRCNSILRDQKGYIWIGHKGGISVYKGDSIVNGIVYDTKFQKNLLIYPNPARRLIFLETSNGEQLVQAKVYDLNGRMLLKVDAEKMQANHRLYQLDLSDLHTSGMLLLQVQTSDGGMMSRPFFHIK